MKFVLIRLPTIYVAGGEGFTPGDLYVDGLRTGYTCEDEDRRLEDNGEKVYGRTCIARGVYDLEVSFSMRFQRELPAVLGVESFTGIRIHGGNRAEASLGCILLGQVRPSTGVAKCAATVTRVIAMIKAAENRNERVTLEIK